MPTNALRVANAKMLELKYEKEENVYLKKVIDVDDSIISATNTLMSQREEQYNNNIKDIKKQRNVAILAGSVSTIVFLALFIIAL